jgi:hypothetical protein
LTLTIEVSRTTSRALALVGKLSLKLADTLTFPFKVSAVSGEFGLKLFDPYLERGGLVAGLCTARWGRLLILDFRKVN